MVGPERWDTPYTFEGVFDKPRSHSTKCPTTKSGSLRTCSRWTAFTWSSSRICLEKMDSIQESDGRSLLDNTLLTYGSGLGDGSTHQYNDLPIIVAGSAGGRWKTGRHLNVADGTPLANLWLTQARNRRGAAQAIRR